MDTQKKNFDLVGDEVVAAVGLNKQEVSVLSSVLRKIEEASEEMERINQVTIGEVVATVCGYLGVEPENLYVRDKSKEKVYCSSLVCYILNKKYNFHPVYLASHFGLHRTQVQYLINKYERLMDKQEHEQVFAAIWKKIRK